MRSSNELRQAFFDYFRDRGHEVVASSSLVPGNDPTLLFTNSGMVQFKDVFLGADPRSYSRAVTSQRCVRAGGKHNDLENVGYTARHHTFFEMLGNFSFGDYFKREAIAFAWEFLTREMRLPPDRMWITVFRDDDEAADIWRRDIGIESSRIVRCGEKDNFWSMGDIGPCGPCSEVFYDHGPAVAGGPPGSPDEDGDRYVEIWNLVFMQYNRDADGNLTRLPKPSVDTGMGLERAAAVLQGVHGNYEIDLFRNLIARAAALAGTEDLTDKSLRVIADHIRSCAFLVVDGVHPSNEGRGYVLRRIIRRAIRHGHRLGKREPFFHRLVGALEAEMGAAYPELTEQRAVVERILSQEEDRFAVTLDQGMRMLEDELAVLRGSVIPGEVAFRLYDTFGFPEDLVADVARERELTVDHAGFERAMTAQRERARSGSRFGAAHDREHEVEGESEFTGYGRLSDNAQVIGLYVDDESVDALGTEDSGVVVLERTPFYPEGGGQVGDRGLLRGPGWCFEVSDTRSSANAIAHFGIATEGEVKIGDVIDAAVDADARRATARNHSATHLLHAALRAVLGTHVQQRGSLVAPDRLRFDFSHFEPVGREARLEIERLVNAWILDNVEVLTQTLSLDEALERGAIAFFGEKYDTKVRVLGIGDVSLELCGGTHVARSGEVGLFKIVSESGIAAGVRRIEAVTGAGALDWVNTLEEREARVMALTKSDSENLEDRVEQAVTRAREFERELERLRGRLAAYEGEILLRQAVDIDGLQVLAARCETSGPKALREMLDRIRSRIDLGLVVLGSVDGEKVSLVAGVSRDLTDRVQAGPLVNFVARQVGGKGGGRPEMAQAGGNDPSKLEPALESVADWVRERLAASG
ncbi:MAG: alanine--tRNA ligase [Immundisolibacterales bacterium]|nr:alanine--tRNA ligase [Immundisolibacterales bacterium]